MTMISASAHLARGFAVMSVGLMIHSSVVFGKELSLADYLLQVKEANLAIKAAQLSGAAQQEKSKDAESVYSPTIFASVQGALDKREQVPVSQRGSQTTNGQLQTGVSKLTDWGTAAKLYYTTSQTQIKDTEERFVPEPSWYESSLSIELSHPLLKNSGGKDLQNAVTLQRTQADIQKLSEDLKRKATLSEAEGAYWRLVIARESVKSAKENLARTKRLVDWSRRRVTSGLADEADLIQADALLGIREIEMTLAHDEERAATHQFNLYRNSNSSSVDQELIMITQSYLDQVSLPQRTSDREDLEIAKKASDIAEIAARLADDKYDPSLDLYASATLHGRDKDQRFKSTAESATTKFPTYVIGLKFSMPLVGPTQASYQDGVAKEKAAATLNFERKKFENDQEWSDLERKLNEAKSRLKLVTRIEETQKKKLDAERSRQNLGRSTLFQVLQYETDFANAQLNVIRTKAEILGIVARMKTFGGVL